jgi:ribosomal protein S18 acetylase RimI-like enzyme
MLFREIEERDLDELSIVRSKTDENNITLEQLVSMGITKETSSEKMKDDLKGWLCEMGGKLVGFSMGFGKTGEMWVIAVLPEYIRQGIGTKLLALVEDYLFQTNNELWLTTDIDTKLRAYSFYRSNGWEDKELKDDLRVMIKSNKV